MGRLPPALDLSGGQFDGASDCLAERRLAGPVLADQCMYLSGTKLEIDVIDGMDAAIDFAAVGHPQHRAPGGGRLRGGLPRQLFDIAHGFAPDVSSNAHPCPLETMTRPCAVSQAAVTPWQRPPTRLCRLSTTLPSSSIRAMRPYERGGAQGFWMPSALIEPLCIGSPAPPAGGRARGAHCWGG